MLLLHRHTVDSEGFSYLHNFLFHTFMNIVNYWTAADIFFNPFVLPKVMRRKVNIIYFMTLLLKEHVFSALFWGDL